MRARERKDAGTVTVTVATHLGHAVGVRVADDKEGGALLEGDVVAGKRLHGAVLDNLRGLACAVQK